MCKLPSSLTDTKGFVCFVTNQLCVHKTFKTKSTFHLFVYIATITTSVDMTQKIPN